MTSNRQPSAIMTAIGSIVILNEKRMHSGFADGGFCSRLDQRSCCPSVSIVYRRLTVHCVARSKFKSRRAHQGSKYQPMPPAFPCQCQHFRVSSLSLVWAFDTRRQILPHTPVATIYTGLHRSDYIKVHVQRWQTQCQIWG